MTVKRFKICIYDNTQLFLFLFLLDVTFHIVDVLGLHILKMRYSFLNSVKFSC